MDWKTRLEDVNSLPAETLADKNEAWEKLHNRLRQKPRKVKAIWYWVAAASLLLMVTISVVMRGKKQNEFVKSITVNIQPPKASLPDMLPTKEIKTTVASSLIEKKKQLKQVNITDQKKFQLSNIPEKKEMILAGLEEKRYPQQQLVISPTVIDSNVVTTTVAVAPVKKKLKVVHINELSGPGEETPNLVKSYEHHSFEFKLINQEVYTSPSLSSSYTLFKSKNIPSN